MPVGQTVTEVKDRKSRAKRRRIEPFAHDSGFLAQII